MKKTEFGIKVYSNNSKEILDCWKTLKKCGFDYMEIFVVPGSKIGPFLGKDISFIVHVAHDAFGANIGSRKCIKNSSVCMETAIEWADKLDARHIILHPGFGKMEDAEDFLKNYNDGRILLENMPVRGINGEKMIGYSYVEIKRLSKGKIGFCLDFGHAIKAAKSSKKDYMKFIKKLMYLKPAVFHLSDGFVDKEIDEHLEIGKGDFDMKFIKSCIKKTGGMVTFEIPCSKEPRYFCENLNRFRRQH